MKLHFDPYLEGLTLFLITVIWMAIVLLGRESLNILVNMGVM